MATLQEMHGKGEQRKASGQDSGSYIGRLKRREPSCMATLQEMHGKDEQRKASGQDRRCTEKKRCTRKGEHVRHAKELWKQSSVCGLSQGIRKHHTATQPAGLPRKPKACPKEEEGGETTSGYGAVAHSRSVKGELGWARYISVVNVSMYHQNWPLSGEGHRSSGITPA